MTSGQYGVIVPGMSLCWADIADAAVTVHSREARLIGHTQQLLTPALGQAQGMARRGAYGLRSAITPTRSSWAFQRCRVRSSMPATSHASRSRAPACVPFRCHGPGYGDLRGRSFVLAPVEDRRDFF